MSNTGHDENCEAFHKRDLPVDICIWCDAINRAKRQQREESADIVLSLLGRVRYSPEFDSGYQTAIERAAAVVRSR